MYQPLVLQIFSDFGFDRDEVADHVGMGEHDSLGLGRGAGRENNFEWIGGLNLSWTKTIGRTSCDCGRQISGIDGCDFLCKPAKNRSPLAWTQHQLRAHLRADPASKIGAGGIVYRN